MTTFREAVVRKNNKTHTENGMKALKSSLNANVDLFFAIGASRGKDITQQFEAALLEDREMALRCLLWARDAREGSGERQIFRSMLQHLERIDNEALDAVLPLVAELGRWDDLLVFQTDQYKAKAFSLIAAGLEAGNSLCAKWMPRKGVTAVELRKFLGMTPKQYRKTLVTLSDTVEQRMCAKAWDSIEFGKLPSLASARYQKAFVRNCGEAYNKYKAALVKGEAKINAGAVYPYDITKSVAYGDQTVAEAQWKALPNWLTEGETILPMIDISGSMSVPAGGNANVSCMDVSISLGLYIAEKQQGPFHGMYLTYSAKPTLDVLKDTDSLKTKIAQLHRNGGYNTNIKAAFDEVLRVAKKNKVAQADMPKYIVIFSDMQFDSAQVNGRDVNAFKMAKQMYKDAGYEMPTIVYWNLNHRGNNTPVEYNDRGVALVSGFSPSLMRSILSAKQVTPIDIMRETLMKPRYAVQL
jgi:hypothetical protein